MENISRKIEFNCLNNTRDLGGMRTADGACIKPGLLFRSGHLFNADEADLMKLNSLKLQRIYDFRSRAEINEKPDPVINGAVNIHMPITRDITKGITRDGESDKRATDMLLFKAVDNPDFAVNYMQRTYSHFVTDDFAMEQYGRFLNSLAEPECGPVLWHCTAGKDRAGFAGVLIEEVLEIPYEDIIADYLATERNLAKEVDLIIKHIKKTNSSPQVEESARALFGARREYIEGSYKLVNENYGGMMNFIKKGLGISEDTIKNLKNKYLTGGNYV